MRAERPKNPAFPRRGRVSIGKIPRDTLHATLRLRPGFARPDASRAFESKPKAYSL
jgi:hypothetical protein